MGTGEEEGAQIYKTITQLYHIWSRWGLTTGYADKSSIFLHQTLQLFY